MSAWIDVGTESPFTRGERKTEGSAHGLEVPAGAPVRSPPDRSVSAGFGQPVATVGSRPLIYRA